MRSIVSVKLTVLSVMSLALASAQPRASSPEILRAVQTVNKFRAQVDAGIAPRQKLAEAEEALADTVDAEVIHNSLENGLTEENAAQATDAALRRLNRVHANVLRQQQLVDAGVLPAQSMKPFTEEQQWAQTQYDLTVSRANLIQEIAEMARAEQQRLEEMEALLATVSVPDQLQAMERFDGTGMFGPEDFKKVKAAFEKEFARPLPISAEGETAVHRAMHFDHSNRVDVAILPDAPEGLWLRRFLEESNIPYYAFRRAVAGKATGAHIHIGPPSGRT
jgi:hypothetical protein